MNDGGQAFPTFDARGDGPCTTFGMSLRDYFAGQALMGLLQFEGMDDELIAIRSYELADAMIAERSKER